MAKYREKRQSKCYTYTVSSSFQSSARSCPDDVFRYRINSHNNALKANRICAEDFLFFVDNLPEQ